jgi:FixJ family two-component response regulator
MMKSRCDVRWRVLKASSFGVELFASGQEFLDSLATRHPDCVVPTIRCPGITGREVQRRLSRAQISLIIVVTAYNQGTVREQCLADGAAAYLAKPLQCERLVGVINAALRLARKV